MQSHLFLHLIGDLLWTILTDMVSVAGGPSTATEFPLYALEGKAKLGGAEC